MEIVPEVLQNYGRAVQHGHRHIYRSLPRMLTIWFDFGSTCAAQKQAANGPVRARLLPPHLLPFLYIR
jgi:serine/threonine-protein kinase ATR